jgi:A/G-specific adenine glycosylase
MVERRPPKGLLGGMLAFPTGPWEADLHHAPPFDADWQPVGEVVHVFTHFRLTLQVMVTTSNAGQGYITHLRSSDLPSLMRKVHDVALQALRRD